MMTDITAVTSNLKFIFDGELRRRLLLVDMEQHVSSAKNSS